MLPKISIISSRKKQQLNAKRRRSAPAALDCLGLEAQDQDSKGKTKTKTKAVTLKTKTKTVKILPRDEAVPRGFPSLIWSIS